VHLVCFITEKIDPCFLIGTWVEFKKRVPIMYFQGIFQYALKFVFIYRQGIGLNITIAVRADTSLNYFCDSRSTYAHFIKFGVFIVAMKKEPLEHNIYFFIQPLRSVWRVLGLSPFHIYPNTKCHNESVFTYSHIIFVRVLIILLLCDLYNSILLLDTLSEGLLNIYFRVLWTIYMLVSNLTSLLALLFTVHCNICQTCGPCYHVLITSCFVIIQSTVLTHNSDHT
jgi:hypothetical protein